MADHSRIEWTEATWNPVSGCTIVSPGCTNCYAMRLAARLSAMGQEKYGGITRVTGDRHKWNGRIRLDHNSLELPKRWTKPKVIFVNSMSDLFHEDVPEEFIGTVFRTMNETPHHTYQVLTKRADRLLELSKKLNWTSNIWMGVSVENDDYTWRISRLRKTRAVTKFLSLEPLLGPLEELNLKNIDWVIVGGESGPGARLMQKEWVRSIKRQCRAADVAFYFKQWGGINKKRTGRTLDGRTWDEFPKPKSSSAKTTTRRQVAPQASVQ